MDVYEAMRAAATVRYYTDQAVDPEALHRILDAARYAPSGGNRQPWDVIVVTAPEIRERLAQLYREPWDAYVRAVRSTSGGIAPRADRVLREADDFAKALHRVPVHLVVCAHLDQLAITDSDLDRPSIVGGASIYPFVQNILLGCTAEGLGATLTTALCRNEPAAAQLLQIPGTHGIAALIAVGHPERDRLSRGRRRTAVSSFVHADRFDH